ncbi:hypothetical protein J2S57_002808 [Kineosporia succinea]|uniref:Uncharacterized protein n=1 Tax=Kineosporia succinea TaxID=84632 RepID=A0ABT9P309_9ACTN|nr:hypothetical protein [Kineosporia succinea]
MFAVGGQNQRFSRPRRLSGRFGTKVPGPCGAVGGALRCCHQGATPRPRWLRRVTLSGGRPLLLEDVVVARVPGCRKGAGGTRNSPDEFGRTAVLCTGHPRPLRGHLHIRHCREEETGAEFRRSQTPGRAVNDVLRPSSSSSPSSALVRIFGRSGGTAAQTRPGRRHIPCGQHRRTRGERATDTLTPPGIHPAVNNYARQWYRTRTPTAGIFGASFTPTWRFGIVPNSAAAPAPIFSAIRSPGRKTMGRRQNRDGRRTGDGSAPVADFTVKTAVARPCFTPAAGSPGHRCTCVRGVSERPRRRP